MGKPKHKVKLNFVIKKSLKLKVEVKIRGNRRENKKLETIKIETKELILII